MGSFLHHLEVSIQQLFATVFSFSFIFRSREPEMLKADVTFNGTQRVVTFEKGSKVQELLYRTRNTFSDKNLDRVPPECLSLRKKGESNTLPNELKLYEDITVVATLASPEENQVNEHSIQFLATFVRSVKYKQKIETNLWWRLKPGTKFFVVMLYFLWKRFNWSITDY